MRLYEGTIAKFSEDVIQNRIADAVSKNYYSHYKKYPSDPEYRSWQQSLNVLNNSFLYSNLKDNKIIIEYELPYSTRRIDVLIFGKNNDNVDNVVLMELKQWSNEHVYNCENEGNIVIDFYGKREVPHPCLQVEGYHFDLQDFVRIFQEKPPIELSSCAYCHNYSKYDNNVLNLPKFKKVINTFPLFQKEDVKELGAYLKERLRNGPGLEVFNRFITSPVRASKKLLDHTGEMISKQQIFTLIDDQIAAYNAIMHKAKNLSKRGVKSIVIVKGGPGTGKSVIALEVMGELMRMGKVVYHATGSSAFTNTLRKIVGRRASNLFKFFFSFTQLNENEIDVLICDEAHRIREHSNDYGVPRQFRSSSPQVDGLIKPARLTLFFIDENQVVRPKEIGNVKLIKEAAKKFGIIEDNIAEFELKTQFRCSGSDAYLQWLDKVLDIRDSDIDRFDTKMEFNIFNGPMELKNAIDKKNREKENCARIVAGFCWPWSKPNSDGSLIQDVKIGQFSMPWEKKDEFWKWATDKSGMEQVGTVYTAQGFEFDYIGVIFGNDLVWREKEGGWVSKPENSFDNQVTRRNVLLTDHLKHVYRVLMSRAHKGVFVYFMDIETRRYFESMMQTSIGDKHEEQLMVSDIVTPEEEARLIPEIVTSVKQEEKYNTHLPVYSLKAACGNFGEGISAEEEGWIRVGGLKLNKNMFISRVFGKSMEPLIPSGGYCVFRTPVIGSRSNKIILAQHRDIADVDNGGQYTVKKYTSKKKYSADGSWEHEEIALLSLNPDYKPINIPNAEEGRFIVIAEFVKVI